MQYTCITWSKKTGIALAMPVFHSVDHFHTKNHSDHNKYHLLAHTYGDLHMGI